MPRVARFDDRGETGERADGGVDRLAIEAIRRRLAPPFDAVAVDDADANEAVFARRAASDGERVRRVNDGDVVENFHPIVWAPVQRAVEAARTSGPDALVSRR